MIRSASQEEHSGKNHKIVPNGYDLGRDWLVDSAVAGSYSKGKQWEASVEWRKNLLDPGNKGSLRRSLNLACAVLSFRCRRC